ncbi:MAG: beta-glucosidase, partial [Proteobacteria bacterium]
PNNDPGVISPTAALSSFPYTPTESMKFLRYLYQDKPNTLIGLAGPYDAFAPQQNWVTQRYLAIDQGTIAPMIENHRTGLLWNLFMNAPEVRQGLLSLGFHSSNYGF